MTESLPGKARPIGRGSPLKKALIGLAIVGGLGVIVAGSLLRERGDKGVEVDVEDVVQRDITRWVKASGEIDPRVKVNISTHVVGRIEHLYVEEGDWIEKGQPFLQLEQEAFIAARDDWQARLETATTDVRQAKVDLADAELKLKRKQRLADEGIASQEDLEAAELTRTAAELHLEQAQQAVVQTRANLDKALDDLSKTTIYAPLSGRVIELNAEQGEVVVSGTMNNPASVIGTIADLSEILAEVDVDETEIVYVKEGQDTDLAVDAVPDTTYTGRVVEVGSSGYSLNSQQDVTFFKVKVLLDNPDEQLRPGMSVRAEIDTAVHKDVPVAPIQAVVQRPPIRANVETEAPQTGEADEDEEVSVVFVVEDGKAEQRQVVTGISDTTHVEITSGVEAGERVVVGPYRTLRDLDNGDAVVMKKGKEGKEDNEDSDRS
jgi:HlyD family secretion protein